MNNNPLAQKAQYYLNESHRLSEELKSEEAYSELLENILFKLLGEEDFTKLFEYVMQGTITHGPDGKSRSPQRSKQIAHRLGQIRSIGQKAAEKGDEDLVDRAAYSAVAKGADADRKPGNDPGTSDEGEGRHFDVTAALQDKSPMHITKGSDPTKETDIRTRADKKQKRLSADRRAVVGRIRDRERNTF